VAVRVTARPVPGRARPTTRAGARPRSDLVAPCRPTCGSGRRCRRISRSRRTPARPRSRSRSSRTTSPPRPRPARPRRFRMRPQHPPPGLATPPRPSRRPPLLLRLPRLRLRRLRPLLRRLRRLRPPRPRGHPRPDRARLTRPIARRTGRNPPARRPVRQPPSTPRPGCARSRPARRPAVLHRPADPYPATPGRARLSAPAPRGRACRAHPRSAPGSPRAHTPAPVPRTPRSAASRAHPDRWAMPRTEALGYRVQAGPRRYPGRVLALKAGLPEDRAREAALARACPRRAAALMTFRVPGVRATRITADPRLGRGVLRPDAVVPKAPHRVPRPWARQGLARRDPQGGPPRGRAPRVRASPTDRIPSPDRRPQVRHPVLPVPSRRTSHHAALRTRVRSGRRLPPVRRATRPGARARARPYPDQRVPGGQAMPPARRARPYPGRRLFRGKPHPPHRLAVPCRPSRRRPASP
jgi:hypothetical protein